MSEIVRIRRIFRDRLELSHRPCAGTEEWRFSFVHVHAEGRRFIGSSIDVEEAFRIAVAWRNRGCATAVVEGRLP